MKLALARKISKKLVDRKEEVLTLVRQASSTKLTTTEEAVELFRELEARSDDLGLPLTGDEWGERLAIKKKGGGMHFEDADRAMAAAAFQRANVLHSAVTWHEQLVRRGATIRSTVGAFRTKGGSGASLSKAKMVERCQEVLDASQKTVADIFGDAAFRSTISEMGRLDVPQELDVDADRLRSTSVLLADFGGELSRAELVGLRAEKKLTQRFRAPQTLGVLNAAHKLLLAVDAMAQPAARVDTELIAMLVEAIEEVGPMVGGRAEATDDDLDDEI